MHILTRSSAVAAAAALSVVALGVGPAAAHVRVSSADAAPGGYGELTFRVPTESDTASTVRVAVQLPTDTPLASVSTKPVPGWTATTERTTLDAPVTVHGSEVTEVVSQVVWTADPGAGIAPGEYQTFSISAGPMPDAGALALPAVQTYDDGTEAAWIEPTVDGQEEPEYPAPVLELTAAAGDTQGVSAESPTDTTATSTAAAPDGGPSGLAVTGLVVAVVALLAALAGLVTGRRRTTGA